MSRPAIQTVCVHPNIEDWFDGSDWSWGVVRMRDADNPRRNIYRVVLASHNFNRQVTIYDRDDSKKMGEWNPDARSAIDQKEAEYLHEWVRETARDPVAHPPPPLHTTTAKIAKAVGLRARPRKWGVGTPAGEDIPAHKDDVITWYRGERRGVYVGFVLGFSRYRILKTKPRHGSEYWRAEYTDNTNVIPGASPLDRQPYITAVAAICNADAIPRIGKEWS